MAFVQSDNVVEQFASATADPALGHAVLPRTLEGGLHSSHLHIGERFSQLLDDPGAGRMARNIEMENAPAVMADDEEAVQKAESHGGYGKEVHRCDRLAV